MADAILHAEFAPNGTSAGVGGGVCSSGEVLLGVGGLGGTYANRFTIFDPVAATAELIQVVLPATWAQTSAVGVPWDGGVAVAASPGSSATYVVVMYPDRTYRVLAPPVSWGSNCAFGVDGSNRLWLFNRGGFSIPQVYDGSSWSPGGSTAIRIASETHYSGGLIWGSDGTYLIGVNPSTGAIATTHSPNISATGQAVLLDGRFWASGFANQVSGVRLSDGALTTIAVTGAVAGRVAGGAGKLWLSSPTAGWSADVATLDIVTFTHASNIGAVSGIYFAGGVGFSAGSAPTS